MVAHEIVLNRENSPLAMPIGANMSRFIDCQFTEVIAPGLGSPHVHTRVVGRRASSEKAELDGVNVSERMRARQTSQKSTVARRSSILRVIGRDNATAMTMPHTNAGGATGRAWRYLVTHRLSRVTVYADRRPLTAVA